MPRKAKPETIIYFLIDKGSPGWPAGEPFYCGKTFRKDERLRTYKRQGRKAEDRLGKRIAACAPGNFEMKQMAVVPHGGDWETRENWYIAFCRRVNPKGCCNIADGGQGGMVEETRERMSRFFVGRVMSPETCAKISAGNKRRWVERKQRAA